MFDEEPELIRRFGDWFELRAEKLAKWVKNHQNFSIIAIIAVLLIVGGLASLTQPPPPPTDFGPAMNVGGFVSWILNVKLPALGWLVVFVFLWLTKW